MQHCLDCGSEVEGNYCYNCRKYLNSEHHNRPPPPPQDSYHYRQSPYPYPPPPRTYYRKPFLSKRDKTGLVIVIFVVIILVGIIIFAQFLYEDFSEIDIIVKNDSGYDIRVYLNVDGEDVGTEYISSGEEIGMETNKKNDEEHTIELYFYYLLFKYNKIITTKNDVIFTIDPDLVISVSEI